MLRFPLTLFSCVIVYQVWHLMDLRSDSQVVTNHARNLPQQTLPQVIPSSPSQQCKSFVTTVFGSRRSPRTFKWRWIDTNKSKLWCKNSFDLHDTLKFIAEHDIDPQFGLHRRFEHPGEICRLPNVDVFVSTADPQKEPPLVTANVILSVLAVDYPIDKWAKEHYLQCHISPRDSTRIGRKWSHKQSWSLNRTY